MTLFSQNLQYRSGLMEMEGSMMLAGWMGGAELGRELYLLMLTRSEFCRMTGPVTELALGMTILALPWAGLLPPGVASSTRWAA